MDNLWDSNLFAYSSEASLKIRVQKTTQTVSLWRVHEAVIPGPHE